MTQISLNVLIKCLLLPQVKYPFLSSDKVFILGRVLQFSSPEYKIHFELELGEGPTLSLYTVFCGGNHNIHKYVFNDLFIYTGPTECLFYSTFHHIDSDLVGSPLSLYICLPIFINLFRYRREMYLLSFHDLYY